MAKYQTYLESKQWKEKRRATMSRVKSQSKRAVFQCELCKEFFHTNVMQVHHKTYIDVGNETPKQLLVLCVWCHRETHGMPRDLFFLHSHSKDDYRMIFDADKSNISDGEMNHARNRVLNLLAELN